MRKSREDIRASQRQSLASIMMVVLSLTAFVALLWVVTTITRVVLG